MRTPLRSVLAPLFGLALACGGETGGTGVFGSAGDSGEGGDDGGDDDAASESPGSGADTSAGLTGDSGDAEGDDGAPVLDVAGGMDTVGGCAEGSDCGCTAVDVLFVIDNSGSMCFYQESLVAAFPGFVDAMGQALPPGTDLHVGITTSGFALGGSHSENNCVAAESDATIDEYFVRPTEGMVAGNGLQGRLLEHDGQPFFAVDTADAAGMDALKAWFSGAATAVGCSVSSFEFNAAAAAWALHPANAATNADFVRDEGAALVIFVLSDEGDQSLVVEQMDFLHDTIAAAKAGCGGDECIVSGGLFSPWCTPQPNAAYALMETFGEPPVWGEIGTPFGTPPDYAAVVGDALAQVVAETCETIPPAG